VKVKIGEGWGKKVVARNIVWAGGGREWWFGSGWL
jgi:hypothetical protein